MTDRHPARILQDLVNGHVAPRCLHVIAEFGVADALGERPETASVLAARTGLDAGALDRMLRLLAAYGVFAREGDAYVHTPVSRHLRSDHPQSLRSFARTMGSPIFWKGFTELAHAARTGKPATDWAGILAHFAQHPDEGRMFNEAMAGKSIAAVPAVLEAYDFSAFGTIADIGGGRGHLLRAILERVPGAQGILFELPQVIEDAAREGIPRTQLVAGDFFVDPLPAADAYLLMEIIHDWGDDDAARILAAVRRAAPTHARVLIVETLVPDSPGPGFAKTLDVIMLAITGGRERTPAEFETLLAGAGLRLERVIRTPSHYSIVEATVA
ncbi:MAG: methyltransferase [Pseudomonadota bacterium]|jgi:O-methyltransferase.|nr:hypothetical protein [Gammaproteobacteria bacterium]